MMRNFELILSYLYHKSDRLDREYHQLWEYRRYRVLDEVDYLELIIAKVRMDTFDEFSRELRLLLGQNTGNYTK